MKNLYKLYILTIFVLNFIILNKIEEYILLNQGSKNLLQNIRNVASDMLPIYDIRLCSYYNIDGFISIELLFKSKKYEGIHKEYIQVHKSTYDKYLREYKIKQLLNE